MDLQASTLQRKIGKNGYLMFRLETKRLILRDMTPCDENAFVQMSQDNKYQRFYSESDCDPQKYRQLTALFIQQANEIPRRSYQLAIESKCSGDFIGTVSLRLETDHQASMGCGIARRSQGQRLIHEAAKALAEYGFTQLDVQRIYAETISENTAAIKLALSLGMEQQGYFRQHRFFKGRWWDTVVLAIVRSQWQTQYQQESSNWQSQKKE